MVSGPRTISEEVAISSGTESENDRSSSENSINKNNKIDTNLPSTTLSSVISQDSTEQLIVTKQENKKKLKEGKSTDVEKPKCVGSDACSKSILTSLHSDISAREKRSKIILYLGMGQVLIGVAMVGSGGLVMVEGAALGKAGAGLWAGCIAVVTGVMGILGGINDCYGLYERKTSRMGNLFLTLFLGLSLISLAAGNLAAVLAGTGILRDVRKSEIEESENTFWSPILANIGLLVASVVHCLLSLFSVYHTAKRVCSCFKPRQQFNHNQFDPSYSNLQAPYSVVSVSEKGNAKKVDEKQIKDNRKELSKVLEKKLNCGSDTDTTDEANRTAKSQASQKSVLKQVSNETTAKDSRGVGSNFGSANSKDKLVCNWLGGQPTYQVKLQSVPKNGIKKKMKTPVFLVPATAGNTLTRPVPMPLVPISAARLGYATLPMVPAGPPQQHTIIYPPHPAMYQPYPINENMVRIKRKRYSGSSSPQTDAGRRRTNQLTRSLERIYRQRAEEERVHSNPRKSRGKKKSKPITDADVIRTYTGLDRTIAEQFIAACDENRHGTGSSTENTSATKSDSSAFDSTSSRNSKVNKK